MGRGWWCSGQGCPGREWEEGGGVVARGNMTRPRGELLKYALERKGEEGARVQSPRRCIINAILFE